MRGELPRTVALLAKAAPEAISKRDASGLTPVHWLWIRFVSTLLAIEDGRGNSMTVTCNTSSTQLRQNNNNQRVTDFTFSSLEQDNFETDLQLMRRIDPTVDFLRMRHIPIELQETNEELQTAHRLADVQEANEAPQSANRLADVLKSVRERLESTVSEGSQNAIENNRDRGVILNRREAITTLFWIKVVSLLKAIATMECSNCQDHRTEDLYLVKTAFEIGCCPPAVARIVALLFPNEFSQPDANGRTALHYSAMRPWHAWEWPREDGTGDAASSKFLNLESASLLRTAVISPFAEVAAKHEDNIGCLPIHYMISTCIQAWWASGRSCSEDLIVEMLKLIGYFVELNPSSLSVCDPRTRLLPYLQASAESTQAINHNKKSSPMHDELPLSIVYLLLRKDPSLIQPVAF